MAAFRAWARRHELVVDCIIALALFGFGLLSFRLYYDIGTAAPHTFPFAIGVAVVALLTLPLALRRRVPPLPMVCVALAVTGYTVWGVTQDLLAVAALVAVYSVAAYSPPRIANAVLGVCIAVIFGNLAWTFSTTDVSQSKTPVLGTGFLLVGENPLFLIAAWVIGDVARSYRLQRTLLAERNVELQTAQEMIAKQAVLDERVRIAREVHDVVAHHVSVMGVQAGAARVVMARSPDQAMEVLSAIEESSRQAVAELQRLLGFLRSGSDDASGGTAPPPTLSRLEALVSLLNDAGLQAGMAVEGTPRPLPASVDLSAYRVAQEAMTNALKHGGVGTIVTVTVRYAADNLELEILDDSRGKSYGSANDGPAGLKLAGGHGLVGMRERVALHGGRFEAGPRIGSGFAVHASFPLPAAAFRLAS